MSQIVDEKSTNNTKKLVIDLQKFLENECIKHNYSSIEIYASIIYFKTMVENILEAYYGSEKFLEVIKTIQISNPKSN